MQDFIKDEENANTPLIAEVQHGNERSRAWQVAVLFFASDSTPATAAAPLWMHDLKLDPTLQELWNVLKQKGWTWKHGAGLNPKRYVSSTAVDEGLKGAEMVHHRYKVLHTHSATRALTRNILHCAPPPLPSPPGTFSTRSMRWCATCCCGPS